MRNMVAQLLYVWLNWSWILARKYDNVSEELTFQILDIKCYQFIILAH